MIPGKHLELLEHCKIVLNEYVAPPMDQAIREELVHFVEYRKAEGGAPTDF